MGSLNRKSNPGPCDTCRLCRSWDLDGGADGLCRSCRLGEAVTVRVETVEGWRWREVPADLHRRAILRRVAMDSRLPGRPILPFISDRGAGPWSFRTRAELKRIAEAREYCGS